MKYFFSADLHLGHGNIIKYCNRPFRDADHMNKRLIDEINMRCTSEDVLFHVGDFCCRGTERGVARVKTKAQEWMKMINPQVIHIRGNHDNNNSVKIPLLSAIVSVGKYVVRLGHRPPWEPEIPDMPFVDVYVCGHVHEKWTTAEYCGKPVINVGVDVHAFRPISIGELVNMIEKLKQRKEK